MFIVPITLFSCARRGGAISELTTSRVSITVSISAARTIRSSSECWLETFTNSVRSSSRVGVVVVDADDRLDLLEALERLREPPAPVGGQAGDQDAPGSSVVAGGRLRASLIRAKRDFLFASISCRFSWICARISCARVCTSALSSAASAPAELDGVDRLQEADPELRRQVAEHPQRPEPGEGRRDREVDEPGEPPQDVDLAEDRRRLLGADDAGRDELRLGAHRRLDEAAAAEAAQPVAVAVELLGPLAALREDEHELALVVEQAMDVRRVRGDAADLRDQHREARIALEEVLDRQVEGPRVRVLLANRLGDHRARPGAARRRGWRRAARRSRRGRCSIPSTSTRNQYR